MARDGDCVLGTEDIGFFEDFAADFGESQAVGGGIGLTDSDITFDQFDGD